MRCPICDVSMKEVERRGVVIDICPDCKGIWLDRGELENLLDVVGQGTPESGYQEIRNTGWHSREDDHYRHEHEHRHDHHHSDHKHDWSLHKRRKRGGLLNEIFDIFG